MPLTADQQQLAEDHVNLCRTESWAYVRRCNGMMDFDDAYSAALLGLTQASAGWLAYCAARNFDSSRHDWFLAYALKRIRGSILDEARHRDPVSRTQRRVLKELWELPGDGSDEADAAATGIAVGKVREARTANATRRTQPLPGDDGANGHVPRDETADPESAAVVGGILSSFLAAFDGLDAESRVILAFRYFREMEFADIAEALRTSPERVIAMHDAGVLSVHRALLQAVMIS